MARKKKNDFWDDVDDTEFIGDESGKNQTEKSIDDEEWSAVKCLPLKVIVRILLMIACLVALGSAYIAYEYVGDRYAGGSYSTDYYNSNSFAKEYNKSMDQLMQLVQAMEADPSVTQAGNEEILTTLVENYMGKDTNFSFIILDQDDVPIVRSTEDAKTRIEASHHYVVVSNVDGETATQSSIPGKLLNKDDWSEVLSETSNTYKIYSAVSDELTQTDAYYKANQAFEKMESYFGIARFVGIIAAVIFVICLIFCIMSTGMKRGYDTVCLSWFDKIFTEIALIIMVGVAGALVFAIRKLMTMEGDLYQYACLGLVVVTYGWVIRSYFSIVRRIKAGRLLRCSVIGTIIGGIAHAIGKLPSPLNIIVGAILLIAINGGLVYGVIFLRQYTVKEIPIMFIVAPVVFIIELLALLVHGSGSDEDEAEDGETAAADSEVTDDAVEKGPEDVAGEPEPATRKPVMDDNDQPDWEAMDLGKAIEAAEKSHAQQVQETGDGQSDRMAAEDLKASTRTKVNTNLSSDMNARANADAGTGISTSNTARKTSARQKTEILSVEDVEKAIRASGLTPQVDDGYADGDVPEAAAEVKPAGETGERIVEQTVRSAFVGDEPVKEETIVQTPARKPEVPEAEDDGRVNFVQLNKDVRKEFRAALKRKGVTVTVRAPEKPVIIDIDRSSLRIIISDIFSQIERLSAPDTRTYVEVYVQGGKVVYIVKIPVSDEALASAQKAVSGDSSFEAARKIAEANDGKFIVTMDGNVLKAGMLIDAAQ